MRIYPIRKWLFVFLIVAVVTVIMTMSGSNLVEFGVTTGMSADPGQKSAESVTSKVLLVTAHRSGSTFLGELFNNNNDAFYVFEPLGAIQV